MLDFDIIRGTHGNHLLLTEAMVMSHATDEARAKALAHDLNGLMESQHKKRAPDWQPTLQEYNDDMAAYDAGFAAVLRSHNVTDGSPGGDILHVGGSWYVQFANHSWAATFSPTGLFTITPIKMQAAARDGDIALVDLTSAEPDESTRFTSAARFMDEPTDE